MEILYFALGLFVLILDIFILVKYFQMAKDLHKLKSTFCPSLSALNHRIDFLLSIGQEEEARKLFVQYALTLQKETYENAETGDTDLLNRQIKLKLKDLSEKVGVTI